VFYLFDDFGYVDFIGSCHFFQIRRCSHTSTYWDGIRLGVMRRNQTCIFTKL